jgi:hypothetical protein
MRHAHSPYVLLYGRGDLIRRAIAIVLRRMYTGGLTRQLPDKYVKKYARSE